MVADVPLRSAVTRVVSRILGARGEERGIDGDLHLRDEHAGLVEPCVDRT
jgi:hypothetical protein